MPCSRIFKQIKKKRQQKLMKSGWRWYGADDAISLKEIRQAGVTDVVAALYRRRAGEIWPVEEIRAQADAVRAAGVGDLCDYRVDGLMDLLNIII